jgi:uncharacterized membrane protein YjjB (DUF3815 family)
MNPLDLVGFLVQDAFWSALAALGFAVLFQVPVRALPGCALGGALGHAVRTGLVQAGMDIEMATLIGATTIGFLGMIFAQYWKTPMPIFTVSAAVTLVPGVFAFQTMIAILEISLGRPETANAALIEASVNAIKTALILGAIALGIAAPTLLFSRPKPVV